MERHIKLLTELLIWNWDKSPELLYCGRWDKSNEPQYKGEMDTFIYSYLNGNPPWPSLL